MTVIKSQKWLFIGLYKSPSQNEKYFFENLSLVLTKLSYEYEKIMLIGHFKCQENKSSSSYKHT